MKCSADVLWYLMREEECSPLPKTQAKTVTPGRGLPEPKREGSPRVATNGGAGVGPPHPKISRCPGKRKALAFPVFQIRSPLGCVFDVTAATAPVRRPQCYRRTQARRRARALPGPRVGRGRGTGPCGKHTREAADAVRLQAEDFRVCPHIGTAPRAPHCTGGDDFTGLRQHSDM